MATKDPTASKRVARQRSLLAKEGGARVDAHIDAAGMAKIDSLVTRRIVSTRREAVSFAVRLLPDPAPRGAVGTIVDVPAKQPTPCPFCGFKHTELCTTLDNGEVEASLGVFDMVLCNAAKGGCGARSGYFGSEDEALAAWELRFSAPKAKKIKTKT